MGFAMCVANLGIVVVTTSATKRKQDERFDRLENMLRSIILNQQVLWDALMEIPDVPNDTKPILKRIK